LIQRNVLAWARAHKALKSARLPDRQQIISKSLRLGDYRGCLQGTGVTVVERCCLTGYSRELAPVVGAFVRNDRPVFCWSFPPRPALAPASSSSHRALRVLNWWLYSMTSATPLGG